MLGPHLPMRVSNISIQRQDFSPWLIAERLVFPGLDGSWIGGFLVGVVVDVLVVGGLVDLVGGFLRLCN